MFAAINKAVSIVRRTSTGNHQNHRMFRRRLASSSSTNMTERAGAFIAPIEEKTTTGKKVVYRMPAEDDEHEGTWLQWPHNYGWDDQHVERYESIFLAATRALCTGEKVHIIVYNAAEQERVQKQLQLHFQKDTNKSDDNNKNVDKNEDTVDVDTMMSSQIDFFQWPTDDVWIRDNGPIFVYDETNNGDDNDQERHRRLVVQDWRFNGWGNKADYWLSNSIPQHVAQACKLPRLIVNMVNEGGSIEVDGRGTLLAKKSSVVNDNRNPGWTQHDVERYFQYYLGITNFIWLTGKKGGSDITDDHIDGTASFAQHGTCIVTMERDDFEIKRDYDVLKNAKDVHGQPYRMVHLPLTAKKLPAPISDYGIYSNYYVGNAVVIVPSYHDANDHQAASILQSLYPERKVVSINMLELYKDGGLIHCVTQAQPI
jgi:agmatine deiminase